MGDLAGAARAVEAQLVNDPNDVRSLVRAGLLWARADAYEPAERHLSKAAGLDPKNRDVWLALGEARCRGQQYHPAIEAFERAGQLGDGDGKAKNGVGSALFSLGNRAEAKILFEKAAAQNAGLPGRGTCSAGSRSTTAISRGDPLVRRVPAPRSQRSGDALPEGVALRRAGENDAAAAAFRAALTQDPIHLGARLNLGQLLLALGNEAEGRREIETHGRIARGQQRLTFATASLRLDPSSAASRVGVGEALLELGAAAEALVQFREAIRSKRPRRAPTSAPRAPAPRLARRKPRIRTRGRRSSSSRRTRSPIPRIWRRRARCSRRAGRRAGPRNDGSRFRWDRARRRGGARPFPRKTREPPRERAGAGDRLRGGRSGGGGNRLRPPHGGAGEKYVVETMGSGVALFDADGDGDEDVYLLQGAPMPGAAAFDSRSRFYTNEGIGNSRTPPIARGSGAPDTRWGRRWPTSTTTAIWTST